MTQKCRILLFLSVFGLVYAAVNVALVFLPFIPGSGTFFLWGLIFPTIITVAHWVVLWRSRACFRRWWIPAILASVFYLGLGWGTLWTIATFWAAV